jgi:hypothetical protein
MRSIVAIFLLVVLPALADTRLALKEGEAFTYKVSWAVIPGAGEIKITAQTNTAGATPRLQVLTTTATRGFARWLLQFDATAESFFDPKSGRLLALSESSKQPEKQTEHGVTFDYAAARALYSIPGSADKPRSLAMPAGDPMDLITSLVQTRSWDLKIGEKRDTVVIFDDEFYELTIYAVRTEEVKTALGTFHTLVLEPRMEKTAPKGMFKKGSKVHVWIETDDERRLPVRFEVEFKIGTGIATLTQYDPPTSMTTVAAVVPTAGKPESTATATKMVAEKPSVSDAKNSGP